MPAIATARFAISAISLDLDDTLWACAPVIERADRRQYAALAELCPALGEALSYAQWRAARIDYMRARPALQHDLSRLRGDFLRQQLAAHGGPMERLEALMAQFARERSAVEFYPGALAALADLARDYRLIACTNGNADVFATAAAPHFSAAVRSEEVGVAKPAASIFAAVCRAAGCRAAEILHVGDNVHTDALGALQAGMHSVWLNREQGEWPLPQRPHGEIADIAELPAWLRERCSRGGD